MNSHFLNINFHFLLLSVISPLNRTPFAGKFIASRRQNIFRHCTALAKDLRRDGEDGEIAHPLLADNNDSGVAGVYAFAVFHVGECVIL